MVRHPDFTIDRPISETELIAKIEDGQLAPRDEICPSAGYWFALQETLELRNFFPDIRLDSLVPSLVETTSTTLGSPDTRTKILEVPVVEEPPVVLKVEQKPKRSTFDPSRSFQEEEELASRGSRIFFIFILLFIFFGTLYLLWASSR